jgi:hypothetical protein
VFLLKSALFIISHPAALALSGYICSSAGTPPSIFFISAIAASDGVGSSALAVPEGKINPHTAAMTKMAVAKDCLMCLALLMVVMIIPFFLVLRFRILYVVPHYFPKKDYL